MKYLKRFNEAVYSLKSDNEYYYEISENEYRKLKLEIPDSGANINKTIDIPISQYQRIEDIIKNTESDKSSSIRYWKRPYGFDIVDEINIEINGPISIRCGSKIQIHMVEDEWYLVFIEYNYTDLYYKCDQIEGVEHLLTDLFEKKLPSAKMIDDFKKVNESMVDYEDFLFSFFDKDPSFIDQSENWLYVEYNQFVNPSESLVQADIVYENLKRYLNGPRFTDLIIKSEMDYGDFYVLVVEKEFYKKHIKVEELNWEQHPLAKELGDSSRSFGMSDAKVVKDLPNNCSLIRGLNFSGGIEFWPRNVEPDPIYVKNNIELQYFLYKHTI